LLIFLFLKAQSMSAHSIAGPISLGDSSALTIITAFALAAEPSLFILRGLLKPAMRKDLLTQRLAALASLVLDK
jgi:hypothetical protein